MDIKDILSVGLTAEDFDTCIEGLDAIPEKEVLQSFTTDITQCLFAASLSPRVKEEMLQKVKKGTTELHKKLELRKEDLTILKSKLILLKRLLSGNEAVRMANDVLNSTPPYK